LPNERGTTGLNACEPGDEDLESGLG